MPTITQAIDTGASRLRACGVDEDRRTAGVLLGHVLGMDRARLLIESNMEVDQARLGEYLSLIDRRASGEPLQYITGHQEFYGLDFIVNPDVLIPRPETEFLVERVLALSRQDDPLIVDIGTGSGSIAVTLAVKLKTARVMAIDISGAALKVASANAHNHRVADRIEFIEGDLLDGLVDRGLENRVDFLVSNPPYVSAEDLALLQREVRDWEPGLALYGGAEGLDFYHRLFAEAPRYLMPGGYMVCEIGYKQLDRIRAMIDPALWSEAEVTADLQGIPRILSIERTRDMKSC